MKATRLGLQFFILVVLFSGSVNAEEKHRHESTAPAVNPKIVKKTSEKKIERKEEPRVPVEIQEPQQSRMGMKIVRAQRKRVSHEIRTVGTVAADQTKEAHVHMRINGWIERIFADSIGKSIKQGQPLFEFYSPDLVSTQEELLSARRQGASGHEIAKAAEERLTLWGVPPGEIAQLKKTGKSKRAITFNSPVSGIIVSKAAIRGMYITPETELYYIADLSGVWLIVTLYEYDVASISIGDRADIHLPYDPSKLLTGKISYIYPEIEAETRTARARLEIENPGQSLKPGMFANVEIKKDLGEAIVIPDDSVIDTGLRRIVFVKSKATLFEPREVKTGARVSDGFIVLSGLKDGEEIVASAHFLIDAESKMKAALEKGAASGAGHGGHGTK